MPAVPEWQYWAQNPFGATVGAIRARKLRAVLAGHPDILLVEDDHAAELAAEPLHPLAGTTTHWALVRSVSKPYGPDLRCAVLAGDDETIGRKTLVIAQANLERGEE